MSFSLRLPFTFPKLPKPSPPSSHSPLAAAAVAVGFTTGLAFSLKSAHAANSPLSNPTTPFQLSLSDNATEPKTGATFPTVLNGTLRLLGTGVRQKRLLGLKNIDVYAFGVYADDGDVKRLYVDSDGKGKDKDVIADVLGEDLRVTVRLQIVYGRLSIRSVRNAFEESVGSRIKKFSGVENEELLHRFTSLFKDEYKLPRGSVIDISREQGHILQTRIDGMELGSIKSKLLCQSILDLYIGDDPFDRAAKENIELNLTSLLQK